MPKLMPTPTTGTEAMEATVTTAMEATDTPWPTTATTPTNGQECTDTDTPPPSTEPGSDTITERDPLMPNPKPMPLLTTDTVTEMGTDTDMDMAIVLMVMVILDTPDMDTPDMDLDTPDMDSDITDTRFPPPSGELDSDTITERDPLMLNPKPMLMLTTDMPDTVMVMAMDTDHMVTILVPVIHTQMSIVDTPDMPVMDTPDMPAMDTVMVMDTVTDTATTVKRW